MFKKELDKQNNNNKEENNKEKKDQVLSVSEINLLIKNILYEKFPNKIKVVGEISNLKISNGHLYMTLKDNNSMINIVSWNFSSRKYKNNITNGTKVTITGNLVTFQKTGTYQINATGFKTEGVGDLHSEYLLIKDFYESAGYFEKDKKKKLPQILNNIGIITSLEGAALKDFLYVLEKNKFVGNIVIKGCIVQGNNCSKSVVASLKKLDEINLDVIVLTRGGGSLEDLFGFSDADVIEQIYNTKTPVISAIGHEIDFMLSDFVADIRAPTPSIAGELISLHQRSQYNIENINVLLKNLYYEISKKIQTYELKISKIIKLVKNSDDIKKEIINKNNQTIKDLQQSLENKIFELNVKLQDIKSIFRTSDPKNIMNKGFCLILDENDKLIKDDNIISSYRINNKKLKLQLLNKKYLIDANNLIPI